MALEVCCLLVLKVVFWKRSHWLCRFPAWKWWSFHHDPLVEEVLLCGCLFWQHYRDVQCTKFVIWKVQHKVSSFIHFDCAFKVRFKFKHCWKRLLGQQLMGKSQLWSRSHYCHHHGTILSFNSNLESWAKFHSKRLLQDYDNVEDGDEEVSGGEEVGDAAVDACWRNRRCFFELTLNDDVENGDGQCWILDNNVAAAVEVLSPHCFGWDCIQLL